MNLYQIKVDRYEAFENSEEVYPSILVVHEKQFSQEEFQKFISLAKLEMGHYQSFDKLTQYLEKYGFMKVTTGYWEN